MKTLYVFGDSFSDPNHSWYAAGEYFWIKDLEKKFTIHNFSIKGSSPYYQLQRLIDIIDTTDAEKLKQSNMIFFMSHITRPNFKFLEPNDHYLTWHIMKPDPNCEKSKLAEKYSKYKNFLHEYNNYDGIDLNSKIIMCYSTIYTLSKFFNKTLLWPCFNDIPYSAQTHYDRNFDCVMTPLIEISNNENYPDNKKNMHLHLENHKIMERELYNWMTKNIKINIKNFIRNINDKT